MSNIFRGSEESSIGLPELDLLTFLFGLYTPFGLKSSLSLPR